MIESMTWIRLRSLLLVTFALFLIFLVGLLFTGHAQNNSELSEHGRATISLWQYARDASFGQAVFENWESEFLQMGMYVVLTAYLVQQGSAESRPIDESFEGDDDPRNHRGDAYAPWPVRHGSPVTLWLYRNSLALLFFILFGLSVWLHAMTGAAKYSQDELMHGGQSVSAWHYLTTSQFWFESFQNWQSEFLAVAVIVGGSVFLRQWKSPQSKPVHAPHSQTGA